MATKAKERGAPVRVPARAASALAELTKATGISKSALLEEAIADLQLKRTLAAITAAYDLHGPAIQAEYAALDGDIEDLLIETGRVQ
jgi:hypothetical protein